MMIYHLKNVLKRDNPFTVYHFNIQLLAFDMFKVSNNIVPTIVVDLSIRSHYTDNLRSKSKILFQVCIFFIMVKILYSITIPLSGIFFRITSKILKLWTYSKVFPGRKSLRTVDHTPKLVTRPFDIQNINCIFDQCSL